MSHKKLPSLARLVDLRKQEVDRLAVDLATKQMVSGRFRKNIERLEGLRDTVGASAGASPALAMNSANYKQSVMLIADAQRIDLSLHEADLALARQSFTALSMKHLVLEKVWKKQECHLKKMAASADQKKQDELAAQSWHRNRLTA